MVVDVQIQNVVATGSLNHRIDLTSVLRVSPGADYRPEHFPGLVYRLKSPRTVILIFGSGKMVCVGAKSENRAKLAVRKVVQELNRKGIILVEDPKIKIQNIVASGDLHGSIDLEKVVSALTKTMYEPEQFPGLIYRMEDPHTVLLLFSTGKFVSTGATEESEVERGAKKLKETLEEKECITYA